jgi:spore germination protein KC
MLAILLIIVLLMLCGCWNKDEPKELASINSILYDVLEDDQYRLVIEVLSPLPASGDAASPEATSPLGPISIEGDSIRATLANLSRRIEKRVFAVHNKVRIFTERFARRGMMSMLEASSRDRLMDETPLMVVIKSETPDETFTSVIGLSDMVGDYLESLAKQQERNVSKTVTVTTLDFIKDYYMEGKQPVMGVVELIENQSQASTGSGSGGEGSQEGSESGGSGEGEQKIIVYEGLAAFKEDKLVGYMNDIETRAYNLITRSVSAALIVLPSEDDKTVVRISKSSSNIKTFFEDEQVFVQISIDVELHIVEGGGDLDISMPEPLELVEGQFNELVQKEVAEAIKKAQTEFKSDIFGFGRKFHIQHPYIWPEFRENWDEHFARAKVEVQIESSVIRSGQIKKPLSVKE